MMRVLLLLVAVLLTGHAPPASSQPTLDCRHSIGPPGNWCPKCSAYPNDLWARRSGSTSCIRCYTGCQIETFAPDPIESAKSLSTQLQCERAQPFTVKDIDPDTLVTIDSDTRVVHALAREFPVAASLLAVLDTAVDPMSMLVPESEFQVSFRNRPVTLTALEYLAGVEQTGRDAYAQLLGTDQDVLATAATKMLHGGLVFMEIRSELRQAGARNRLIEAPVRVWLRDTGARSRLAVPGLGKLAVNVLAVERFEPIR